MNTGPVLASMVSRSISHLSETIRPVPGNRQDLLDADRPAVHDIRTKQLRAAVKEQKKRQGCQAQGGLRLGNANGTCLRGISCSGATECGADIFMQAAPDEQGRVDISRIERALRASRVLQGLNISKVTEALLCEAKVSHGQKKLLTLSEFLEVYRRVTRGLQRAARQHMIAAKTPNLSVPKKWFTDETLQQAFACACLQGETRRSMRVAAKAVAGMSRHQWVKFCSRKGIAFPDGPMTQEAIDLAFVVAVGRAKQQRLSWQTFCEALAHLSSDVGFNIVDLLTSSTDV